MHDTSGTDGVCVCGSVCVYVCTCGWEGGGGGSSDGVESVHEREDGVGGVEGVYRYR